MMAFPNDCARCHEASAIIMSFFNMDMICGDCLDKEKAHPRYQEALDAERAALDRGERHFPGIGKPEDL